MGAGQQVPHTLVQALKPNVLPERHLAANRKAPWIKLPQMEKINCDSKLKLHAIKLRNLVLLSNLKCVPIVKPKDIKLFQQKTHAGSNCQVLRATEISIFRLITRCCHLKNNI